MEKASVKSCSFYAEPTRRSKHKTSTEEWQSGLYSNSCTQPSNLRTLENRLSVSVQGLSLKNSLSIVLLFVLPHLFPSLKI